MFFASLIDLSITVTQLKAASLKQLKFWANQINEHSIATVDHKHFKSISGNTQFLQDILADYLNLDLSTPPVESSSQEEKDNIKPIVDLTALQISKQQYALMSADAEQWGFKEPYQFSDELLFWLKIITSN